MLILDGTSFPETGHGLGRRRPAILRRARQGGELPGGGHGRAVDRARGRGCWARRCICRRTWLTPASADAGARFRRRCAFAPKWQLALTLLRQVRAAGFTRHGGGGRCRVRRQRHAAPHVASRPAAVCAWASRPISKVFLGTPVLAAAAAAGRQRTPAHAPACCRPTRTPSKRARGRRRRRLASGGSSRGATGRTRRGAPASVRSGSRPRTTGASDGSRPKSGCCANATWATAPATKYYLVDLPATASLRALVRLAHQRWAIEQQYQELKDEIGLDHFEGRSLPGWQRHVVLTAHRVQLSPARTPATGADAADAAACTRRHSRGADRAFLHDAAALPEVDVEAQRSRNANLTK